MVRNKIPFPQKGRFSFENGLTTAHTNTISTINIALTIRRTAKFITGIGFVSRRAIKAMNISSKAKIVNWLASRNVTNWLITPAEIFNERFYFTFMPDIHRAIEKRSGILRQHTRGLSALYHFLMFRKCSMHIIYPNK